MTKQLHGTQCIHHQFESEIIHSHPMLTCHAYSESEIIHSRHMFTCHAYICTHNDMMLSVFFSGSHWSNCKKLLSTWSHTVANVQMTCATSTQNRQRAVCVCFTLRGAPATLRLCFKEPFRTSELEAVAGPGVFGSLHKRCFKAPSDPHSWLGREGRVFAPSATQCRIRVQLSSRARVPLSCRVLSRWSFHCSRVFL